VDYFGYLLNMALDRAMEVSNNKLPSDAADFFKCLESGQGSTTHQVAWLRGVKRKMVRTAISKLVDSGKTIDHSADTVGKYS
jgi:hypothetical protein